MKIRIDYSDGGYFWRPAEEGDAFAVVEVPWWRVAWMKVVNRLDRQVNRYLAKLDNDWHDANVKGS